MATHTFDVAAFRVQYPTFASEVKYPSEQLDGYFAMAGTFIYGKDWWMLSGQALQTALELMTAHLAYSNMLLLRGNTSTGITTGAGIDKVNVSLQAPPVRSAWSHWLSTTPFGLQLWALLRIHGRGPIVVGGLPERDAFRRVGGGFGGPRWLR